MRFTSMWIKYLESIFYLSFSNINYNFKSQNPVRKWSFSETIYGTTHQTLDKYLLREYCTLWRELIES